MELHEQYASSSEHHVSEDKLGIGDGWYDAGSNALSNIWHFIDIGSGCKTREITKRAPKTGLTIYAHKTFVNQYGKEFDILVDWMTHNNTKLTTIKTQRREISS